MANDQEKIHWPLDNSENQIQHLEQLYGLATHQQNQEANFEHMPGIGITSDANFFVFKSTSPISRRPPPNGKK